MLRGMDAIQLSRNFYLPEFTRSQEAARQGRPIEVALDSEVFRDLQRLCRLVLQQLREALGPVFVSSGYRPLWLNTAIGGAASSQHTLGQAADIVVSGFSPYEVVAWLSTSGLPFDQLIHEFGQWAHISIAPPDRAARGEVLTAYKPAGGGATLYAHGLHRIEELAAA
jgi:zinc D-Ala-D-Ala carboxypeptidase